jgi:hypothetical protein
MSRVKATTEAIAKARAEAGKRGAASRRIKAAAAAMGIAVGDVHDPTAIDRAMASYDELITLPGSWGDANKREQLRRQLLNAQQEAIDIQVRRRVLVERGVITRALTMQRKLWVERLRQFTARCMGRVVAWPVDAASMRSAIDMELDATINAVPESTDEEIDA